MTLGGILSEGFGTAIIGMGIVFLTLSLIAFVISRLKYINVKKEAKKETKIETKKEEDPLSAGLPAEAVAQEIVAQEDTALIAVITAAVAASLGTSSDRLRVLSIRQSSSAWRQVAKKEQHRHSWR